jgi:aerobic-type carbon monoxide dehydrogenase small subunit (CoxS/CutS family)
VNGRHQAVDVDGTRTLLSVLREELALTGTKYGCGEGQCGACTVVLDGRAVRSCRMALSDSADKPITTIEGLAQNGNLHPLQQAFLDAGALQCGYCTAGMIMSSYALLAKRHSPTRQEMIQAMEGNVCRCGTYQRILAAISQAAGVQKGGAT